MADDLDWLGTYGERLPGTSYESKLKSFFKYMDLVHLHEDWRIPGEEVDECSVILTAAEANLKKESMVDAQAEAQIKFNEIRKRKEGPSKSVEDLVHYLS